MHYISKEEVIRLYKKPFSMFPREICKHFGYFISEATVRNYIKQGIKTCEITKEDLEALEERKKQIKEEKNKRNEYLEEIALQKFLEGKTRSQIIKEFEEEYGIIISNNMLTIFFKEAIKNGKITKTKYESIVSKNIGKISEVEKQQDTEETR